MARFALQDGSRFLTGGDVRAVVPAWGGHTTLRRGVKRVLARTRAEHFNCMELTHTIRKRFLGVPYFSSAARLRHIQQGSHMQSLELRRATGLAITA
jgi:hypothetical protein